MDHISALPLQPPPQQRGRPMKRPCNAYRSTSRFSLDVIFVLTYRNSIRTRDNE